MSKATSLLVGRFRSEGKSICQKWQPEVWNHENLYGFIQQEDGTDVFDHHSGIKGTGFRSLNEGDRVTFDMEPGKKGPAAVNVTVV